MAGRARAFAVRGLLIGALLAAGSAYPIPHGPSVAEAKPGEKPAGWEKAKHAEGEKHGKGPPGHQPPAPVKDPAPAEHPAATPPTQQPVSARPAVSAPAAVSTPAARSTKPSTKRRARSRAAPRRRPASQGTSGTRPVTPAQTGGVRGAVASGSAPDTRAGRLAPAAVPVRERKRAAPSSSKRDKAEKGKDADSGKTVTRTVRDIVEVVPGPLKLALAGMMLVSALLAGGYLVTALRARSLARQRSDLLQDVGLLQTALLPPVPAVVGGLRTSVAYRPSEGPGAGGDFYDALTLPDGRAAFILGDVCGHGRQALARTAFMRYTLRAYLEAGLEPCQALQVAGPVIDEHLGGNFATVVLAVHDTKSGSLTYACAGHPAPIVVGPLRPEPVLAGSSPPIGLALRTGVRQTTVPLPPGSVVCLYTDGLAEARTADGILGRPRLGDILEELGRDATAAALIDRVADEARLVTDDMATVVLKPTAGVTVGGFREERLEVNDREVREGLAARFLEACGVEEPHRSTAITEAAAWAGSHSAAVLHVRFGTRGAVVEVLPRNVEGLGSVSRGRARA